MQIKRLLPLAAVAGLAVGLGVAAFPGDPRAETRTGPQFTPSKWEVVFDFVSVGSQSPAQVVTITNGGGSREIFSAIALVGPNNRDFRLSADGCTGQTLLPGGHCEVSIVFAPTAKGTRVASLKFTDNTACANWIRLAGSGTEAEPAPTAHASSCQGPESTTVTTTTPTKTTDTAQVKTTTVVRTVATQPSQVRPPAVNTKQATKVIRLPARKCHSRRKFRIHLVPPAGKTFEQITVKVNGRQFRVVRGKQITSRVDLSGLPRGRFTLRIRATLLPSGLYVRLRHYVTCVPKRS